MRVLFLVLLATSRGVYTCIEQPSSSKFKHLPEYVKVKQLCFKFICGFFQRF